MKILFDKNESHVIGVAHQIKEKVVTPFYNKVPNSFNNHRAVTHTPKDQYHKNTGLSAVLLTTVLSIKQSGIVVNSPMVWIGSFE